MVDALRPTLGHTFDTSWFETLKSALTWHGSPGDMQAKHESQCFIGVFLSFCGLNVNSDFFAGKGFDCLHNGDTLVKVYFMPERRAIHMGVPKEQLVTDGLSMLNMDLEGVWRGWFYDGYHLVAYLSQNCRYSPLPRFPPCIGQTRSRNGGKWLFKPER